MLYIKKLFILFFLFLKRLSDTILSTNSITIHKYLFTIKQTKSTIQFTKITVDRFPTSKTKTEHPYAYKNL